ncbi:MAG TPA: hypothetical protein VFU81_21980, partial [Thermomicrobiales bacterium]|nr:hypothetical protein [Thermomicrobiales bacterium]
DDLVVQVAIVRPGPIEGGAMNPYIRGRQALRRDPRWRPTYDHPALEPILEETLGVILYQEQVLATAMALAGFTAGQADQLRRAMTRKRSHEAMLRLWSQFRDGALAREVDLETAKTIFRKLMGFASYGFPKAHAAAFALLAYQSCWLKQRYPAEFVCALLNNQPMGFYPPHVLTNDARRHGVRILPPDVNASDAECSVAGNAVRIGLGFIAELGDAGADRIVAARTRHGSFRSLADLIRRVPLRQEAAEHLVAVGAADGFGLGRREALWQLGLFIPPRAFGGGRAQRDPGRQLALALPVDADMVALPPTTAWERMAIDYQTLGLSPRYHPLGLLRPHLPAGIVATTELERLPDGMPVVVVGLVVCRQRPGTAKGVTFLLLEDEHGLANVIIAPALYEARRPIVRGEPFLIVAGTLQRRGATINILARRLEPIEGVGRTLPPPPAPDAEEMEQERPQRAADLRALAPASHDYR